MKKRLKKIPQFKSEAEERKFWATHEGTDYFDLSKGQLADLSEEAIDKIVIAEADDDRRWGPWTSVNPPK